MDRSDVKSLILEQCPVPNDIELEQTIIDALFTWDSRERDELAAAIRSKHFYSPFHQSLFEAGLKTNFVLVDAVDKCIESNDNFDTIYQSRIADVIGTTKAGVLPKSSWESWAKKLIHVWCERRAHEVCLKQIASTGKFDLGEFVNQLADVEETYEKPDLGPDPVMGEIIDNAINGVNENEQVCTGWRGLDELLQGMERSDVVVIAAPANTGKSRFTENIAKNRAKIGLGRQFIISYEMTKKMIVKDLISMTSSIPSRIMKYGRHDPEFDVMLGKLKITEDQYVDRIKRAGKWISDNFAIVDPTEAPRTTFGVKSLIKSYAKEAKANGDTIDAIYVDYLQKICGDDKDKIDEWMHFLTNLPFDLRNEIGYYVPVFLVSATNRDGSRRAGSDDLFVRPSQSDLRGSGNIEFWAAKIIFLCHVLVGGQNVPDQRVVFIEKNKAGDAKLWRQFKFKGHFLKFEENK